MSIKNRLKRIEQANGKGALTMPHILDALEGNIELTDAQNKELTTMLDEIERG